MSRELFLIILNGVRDYDDYFEAKYDCTGKIGFTCYQKCSAAVRQLAYGVPGDLIDDYMRMSESTCHEAMYRFYEDVTVVFGEYYLRESSMHDTARLWSINESRGFLGCLAALTACIGSQRTVLLVGKGSSKGIRRGAPLYWRPIFGFSTPFFLVWQEQTMISMCCIALRYFLGLLKELLLRFPMRSIVTLMIRVII
jgi:hypothetical protein